MKKGDHAFRRNENLLMVHYKDKKEIYFLDTIHEVKTERAPKRGREDLGGSKLSLVKDYNKYMGDVDRIDALIGSYTGVRKTYKWTIKVLIHFIDEAVLNAFILYNKQFAGKMRFMNYKIEVIEKSLQRASATDETNTNPKIGRHFLQLITPTEKRLTPRSVVWFAFSTEEERKADTSVSTALRILDFAQHHVLNNFIHYKL